MATCRYGMCYSSKLGRLYSLKRFSSFECSSLEISTSSVYINQCQQTLSRVMHTWFRKELRSIYFMIATDRGFIYYKFPAPPGTLIQRLLTWYQVLSTSNCFSWFYLYARLMSHLPLQPKETKGITKFPF